MSYFREFASEWAKMMGRIVAGVIVAMAAFGALFVVVLLPTLVGSYIEFRGFPLDSGLIQSVFGVSWWYVAIQYAWLATLLGAFLAWINLDDRRDAESNGGDSA